MMKSCLCLRHSLTDIYQYKEGISLDLLERLEEKDNSDGRLMPTLERINKENAVKFIIGLTCLVVLLAAVIYTAVSKQVYFWDNATYWEMGRAIVNGDLKPNVFSGIWDSICNADYNYVPAIPAAIWMFIFGQTRMSYIIGTVLMYLLPIVLLTYRLAKKLTDEPVIAFLVSVFTIPFVTYMAICGFADLGGVLIVMTIFSLYYTRDGVSYNWYNYIVIGCLLVLLMLFRNYFAFFVISFITAMITDCIIFKRKWGNILTVIVIVIGLMLTIFLPFCKNVLIADYGDIYSGYVFHIGTDLKFFTRYFGLLFLLLVFILPLAASIAKGEYRPAMLWLQLIVCAAMYMSVRTHDRPQLLMYVPIFIVLIIFTIKCFGNRIVTSLLAITAILNICSVYMHKNEEKKVEDTRTVSILPSFSMKAEKRNDTMALLAVKRNLDGYIPEGSSCGVVASSFIINDGVLRNVELSLGEEENRDPSYIISMPEIDARDYGRLDELYNAEYILVAIPSQTYLPDGLQSIVDAAVDSFQNHNDIAELFNEVDGFSCYIDNIHLKLYKRYQDIDAIRKREFESKLNI